MALKKDEDLFAETTMSFGEHLEELRVCLWKAVVGLVLGTFIGLFLGDYVVAIIEHPLRGALKEYYKTAAEQEYSAWAAAQYDAGKTIPYTLKEIRKVAEPQGDSRQEMIYELEFVHPAILQAAAQMGPANATAAKAVEAAGATSGPVAENKVTTTGADPQVPKAVDEPVDAKRDLAVEGSPDAQLRFTRDNLVPMLLWHPIQSDGRFNLQATGTTEVFTVWLKAALVVGVLLSSPWVFFQIWTFVASGLYHHERKYVYTFLPFSLGLFFLGASTAYLFVFEPVLTFLFSFNKSLGIDPDPKISEWLGFVLLLPLGFGVSFQLPLVMLFLERIGVFTAKDFMEKWRIAILAIFILSAVLTPADPYSIFFMAVPLTFLYFGGILLAIYLPRQKAS